MGEAKEAAAVGGRKDEVLRKRVRELLAKQLELAAQVIELANVFDDNAEVQLAVHELICQVLEGKWPEDDLGRLRMAVEQTTGSLLTLLRNLEA
jgi:hypothetical protein